MKQPMVWVEVWQGYAIRIFKSANAAFAIQNGNTLREDCITQMPRREAVAQVRHLVYVRSRGECEDCDAPLTEDSGHMHERKHRGKGGEISVENSVFICEKCHKHAHRDRNPHWKKSLTSGPESGTLDV